MPKKDFSEIQSYFKEKGVKLLSSSYKNNVSSLEFECTKCGKPYQISWNMITQGKNPQFLCKSCNPMSSRNRCKDISEVDALFRLHNIERVGPYVNYDTPIKCKCQRCNSIIEVRLNSFSKVENFICEECKNKESKYKLSEDFIRKYCLSVGSEYIEGEILNEKSIFVYSCIDCGRHFSTSWAAIRRGRVLKCPLCGVKISPSIDFIRDYIGDLGATLISKTYRNANIPLIFKCGYCGEEGAISWAHLKRKRGTLLCNKCIRGRILNPCGAYGNKRHNIDSQWYSYIKEFFNIDGGYSSHHIIQRRHDAAFSLSLCNGFPLKKEIHSRGYVDPVYGKDPFHNISEWESPENWPDIAKLPYHIYPNFKFLNLNSKMITTIIYRDQSTSSGELLQQKKYWADKGILFIPIYFEEMFIKEKAQIIYSILREHLRKWFPAIYSYTGQKFDYYYASNLDLKEIPPYKAEEFFEENHISGNIKAKLYVGLLQGQEVVMAMSFGEPQVESHYQWELFRYALKKNSFVVGGAQRLFNFFIRNYTPQTIITYCDLRFSSLDPGEILYSKLGFRYDGNTSPTYKYYHLAYNRLYSRQQFQKYKIEDGLKACDENLSEEENMKSNGYIRQYDCGKMRFIWKDF